jgi:hypothetical protein
MTNLSRVHDYFKCNYVEGTVSFFKSFLVFHSPSQDIDHVINYDLNNQRQEELRDLTQL